MNQLPSVAFVSAPIDTLSTCFRLLRSRARSLSSNDLCSDGVAALAEALKGNTSLQLLE